jgi:ficolin
MAALKLVCCLLMLVLLPAVCVGQRTTETAQQCQQPCSFMLTSMSAQLVQMEQRIQDKTPETEFEAKIQQLTGQIKEIQQKYADTQQTNEELQRKYEELQHKLEASLSNLPRRSCSDILEKGQSQSGIYTIESTKLHGEVGSQAISDIDQFNVYCDMETDGGGWLVFQRRMDGTVNFTQDWETYAEGFGNLEGEFWLGNRNLNLLTSSTQTELRVDMRALNGSTAYAQYSNFSVGTEADNFRLTVGGYSGTAGDSLARHNGMMFSTHDSDHDRSSVNCAQRFRGGHWFNNCLNSNPNGEYLNGPYTGDWRGVVWYHWLGQYYSLPFLEMKMRPLP